MGHRWLFEWWSCISLNASLKYEPVLWQMESPRVTQSMRFIGKADDLSAVRVRRLTHCLHVRPGQTNPPCQHLPRPSATSVTERNHRADPTWLSCGPLWATGRAAVIGYLLFSWQALIFLQLLKTVIESFSTELLYSSSLESFVRLENCRFRRDGKACDVEILSSYWRYFSQELFHYIIRYWIW